MKNIQKIQLLQKIKSFWYSSLHPFGKIFLPLAWLFCAGVKIRQLAYRWRLLTTHYLPIPVIIIGNITVGGTGKTPLVIWLAHFLKQRGYRPGIISRGYGGQVRRSYQPVYPDSNPYLVGDEPLLLARRCDCPIVVAPHRHLAAQVLLAEGTCNILISDDGLQHYALPRSIEIAVIDSKRRLGNGYCLPVGPLREPPSRLQKVDFIVIKGEALVSEFAMRYDSSLLCQVINPDECQPIAQWHEREVHAVAGIGHPSSFFAHLQQQGLRVHCHEFPDHHFYEPTDIQFDDNLPVIMTEKDAVKCQAIANEQHWYLPITAQLTENFEVALLKKLMEVADGQKSL